VGGGGGGGPVGGGGGGGGLATTSEGTVVVTLTLATFGEELAPATPLGTVPVTVSELDESLLPERK
jgi:hypothetical protein